MPNAEQFRQGFLTVSAEHTGSEQQRQALLYADLKQTAHRICRSLNPGDTLQTTALLHETWLRLSKNDNKSKNPKQFLQLAATVMHRIAVDAVRQRVSLKRGGGLQRVSFEEAWHRAQDGEPDALVLQLDEGLTALEAFAPELAELVQLVFFAGLTQQEVARQRGVNERTVRRDWRKARAWLYQFLGRDN